jgi:phospholipid transport system substrate-binding protein
MNSLTPSLLLPMSRRCWTKLGCASLALVTGLAWGQAGTVVPPDQLVKQVSVDVIEAVKTDKDLQAGKIDRIMALVDGKLLPHVNFQRMTALSVGRPWRSASPEQQTRLQEEFKALLLRTYSGALTQVKDQVVQVKPLRMGADDTETVVKTELKGKGEPIQIDYRMEKSATGWRVYDVNVLGVWLADSTFKSQFAPIVANSGIDGLIKSLSELNRKSAAAKG